MSLSVRLLLLVLLAAPFFTALGDSSVWDANEAFYVQSPREMLQRGNWLVPYFNGVPRLNKPPLSYWVVGVFYRFFGVSVFWERLVMAVLAFGGVLFLLGIARSLLSQKHAFAVAAVFATTFRFQILAKRLLIDVLMLFCILGAVFFLVRWIQLRNKISFCLFSVFLGLGFLAKGPVALLPLFLLLVASFGGRRLGVLRAAPWLTGMICFAVVASSWFVALLIRMGPGPVIGFFVQENIGRYTSMAYGPSRGPLYYLGVFAGDFFPWSLLLAASLPWWLNRRRAYLSTAARFAIVPAWVWVLGYLLFFSFSLNKQEYYILPAYPAAALLLGIHWSEYRPGRAATALSGLLLLVVAAGLLLFVRHLFGTGWMLILPPVLAGAAGVLLLVRKPLAAASLLLAFYCLGFWLYLPEFERYKPVAPLAAVIERDARTRGIGSDFAAGYFRYTAPSLAYYLNRPVLEIYDLSEAGEQLRAGVPVYLLVDERDYEKLVKEVGKPLQIVDKRPKLYTTGRIFLEGLKRGRNRNQPYPWTRSIYLITNQQDRRHGP